MLRTVKWASSFKVTLARITRIHDTNSIILQDLKYKGILKITYDRGYAVQTKSMLVESTTTAMELIEQLIDTLGLTGGAEDYVLEERNLMTNGELSILLTSYVLHLVQVWPLTGLDESIMYKNYTLFFIKIEVYK